MEAYQAGIEGRTLPYDRERILLMEPSDFPDAADRKKFVETRADIIATDQLTRANIANPEQVAQIRQTAEFASFRDTIYAAISNPNVIRPGSKILIDFIGVTSAIKTLALGKAGEDLDLSRAESRSLLSDIMYKMQDADPIGTKRVRALDEKIDDFYKNERGEVSPRVALTMAMLAAAAIYVRTAYDAETVETKQSFGDWAAEKAPAVLASVPAAAVELVGLHLLAMAGPIGLGSKPFQGIAMMRKM